MELFGLSNYGLLKYTKIPHIHRIGVVKSKLNPKKIFK